MRVGLFLVAAALIAAAPAHRAPLNRQSLPVFEFRDLKAGVKVDDTRLDGCKPGQVVRCSEADESFAGVTAISISPYFYKNQLSRLELYFKEGDGRTIRDALEAKYGKPCKGGINPLGYFYFSWCFSSGTLTFTDPLLSAGYLIYEDDNHPPKPAPKVDF
jgi:hypothetical protein